MSGMTAVFWKELADHFGSRRFILLFTIICLAGLSAIYTAGQTIRGELAQVPTEFVFLRLFTTSGGALPPFISFLSFFIPLIGIIFGFDAINSEHSRGTLSRVLSQPLFRDSFINGKFLAGITAIAIMLASITLVVSGLGLRMIGVAPNPGEIARIGLFFVLSVIYAAFWLGLAMLFSVLIRRTATSVLAPIAIWLFFAFFMFMIAGVIADTVAPIDYQSSPELQIKHTNINRMVMRVSPTTLFNEATFTILTPTSRLLGPVLQEQVKGLLPTPLAIGQSLMVVWPHIVSLIALTIVCFAISYIGFMRQEIRS